MTPGRPIGLLHATSMVVGIMIGASIFVQPSEVNRHAPSVVGALVSWGAAGLLALFGALVCAELSSAYPRTGGVYVFLKETLSPSIGFLWGWAMFWSVHSGIIAASSVIFGRYVGVFIPLDDTGIRVVAIAGILVLSAVNYLGARQGSRLQTAVTIAKLAAIVWILAFVLFSQAPHARQTHTADDIPFSEFILAISAGLFAFGGWHMVTYAAGETQNPSRTIPRSLMIGTLTVTACYIALNATYLYLLPIQKVIQSTRVAADAAEVLAGPRGANVIAALVILSSIGVLNGVILAGPRMYYAMALEGLAFRSLATLHPKFQTPHRALIAQAVWASFLVATGTYRQLFTRVIYTEWIFFALMTVGLFLARRRSSHQPDYRILGYPVTPALFLFGSVLVVCFQVAADVTHAASGLFIVVLGLPVYYFWIRRSSHAHH